MRAALALSARETFARHVFPQLTAAGSVGTQRHEVGRRHRHITWWPWPRKHAQHAPPHYAAHPTRVRALMEEWVDEYAWLADVQAASRQIKAEQTFYQESRRGWAHLQQHILRAAQDHSVVDQVGTVIGWVMHMHNDGLLRWIPCQVVIRHACY